MRMQQEIALVKDEEWALVECESSSEIGSINESDEDGPSGLLSCEMNDSESELGAGSDGYGVCILRRSTRLAVRRDGDVVAAAQELCEHGIEVVLASLGADGMIAEHWDVLQDVPANPVNPNSMF
jgi:hypothetical protein